MSNIARGAVDFNELRFLSGSSGKDRALVPFAKAILATGSGLILVVWISTIYILVRSGDTDRLIGDSFDVRALVSDLQDAETQQSVLKPSWLEACGLPSLMLISSKTL
jgi:hypothetical protein